MFFLPGFGVRDTNYVLVYLADRWFNLLGFSDADGKMNRSSQDVRDAMRVVTQFALCGDCQRGRRPSFDQASPPGLAKELYEYFCHQISAALVPLQTGVFQADMQVSLINDGPVTFYLERGGQT